MPQRVNNKPVDDEDDDDLYPEEDITDDDADELDDEQDDLDPEDDPDDEEDYADDEYEDTDDEDYEESEGADPADEVEEPEVTDDTEESDQFDDTEDTEDADGETSDDDVVDDEVDLEEWDADEETEDEDGDGDVDARDSLIKHLRKENAKRRTELRDVQAAAENTLAEMLGGLAEKIGYDGELDPDGIASHFEASRKEASNARRDLSIYKAATSLGADTDRLTDSRSFTEKIDALDPTEKAYEDAVAAEVRRFVERDPAARRANRAPRSSGDFTAAGSKMPTGEMSVEELAKQRRKRRE